MSEVMEGLRWLNAAIGFAALIWLGIRMWLRRHGYPHAVLLFLQVLMFYAFACTYISVEMAVQNTESGLTAPIILVSDLALITALALTQKRRPVGVRRG